MHHERIRASSSYKLLQAVHKFGWFMLGKHLTSLMQARDTHAKRCFVKDNFRFYCSTRDIIFRRSHQCVKIYKFFRIFYFFRLEMKLFI